MSLPTIAEYPERYHFRYCPRCATALEVAHLHEIDRQRCPSCGQDALAGCRRRV